MVQKSAPLLTLTTTHTERQEPLVGVQANSASRQSKQLVAEGVVGPGPPSPPTRRLSFRLSSGPSGLLPAVSAVTLASDYGESCARLNWLPDSYGSEGWGFESLRAHHRHTSPDQHERSGLDHVSAPHVDL